MTQSGLDALPAPTPPRDPSPLSDPVYVRNANRLCKVADEAELPRECIQPLLDHLLPLQSEAGARAKRFQRKHVWASRGIFFLSAAAVTVAVAQVVLFDEQH